MTKDGRPSRLRDLRLFYPEDWEGEHEAVAFGRRICWWLNSEGFGIGHDPSLYLTLNPALPDGQVVVEPPKFTPVDWWFRQVSVGVPDGFPRGIDAVALAQQRIVDCLTALKPADSQLLQESSEIVASTGNACRFLLKVRESAQQLVEVSTTIGTWPEPSLLYVGLTDTSTGAYREAPPTEVGFYDDGVLLAGTIKANRQRVELVARTSTAARMLVERRGAGLAWSLGEFRNAERPMTSALLRFD